MKISAPFKVYLFVFLTVYCLNIRHSISFLDKSLAQKTPIPAVRLSLPGTKTVSGAAGKYYEYQSICRNPNTEEPFDLKTTDKKINEALGLIQKNKYRDAITLLTKNLETNGENIDALYAISYAYRKYTNLYEAKSALQDIIKIERTKTKKLSTVSKKYLIDLCILEVQDSNHNDADDTCKLVIKALPEEISPLIYLAVSYREQERYKEALELLERSLKIKKSEFALTCRAEIYHLQKKPTDAIKAFDASVAIDDQSARAHFGKAMVQYELEKYDEALESFAKACKLDKGYAFQFRKAQAELDKLRNPISEKYYASIKKCLK